MFSQFVDFNDETLDKIHVKTLDILEKIGMRVLYKDFYAPLRGLGAQVDENTGIVRFPAVLIENTIEDLKNRIRNGQKQVILNGVVSGQSKDALGIKFAGACIEFLDPLTNIVREPEELDLIRLVAFGESLPEVTYVGNPVSYLRDKAGNSIPPNLQRIMTAALVAKYTTKYGSNEIWNETELELLMELGTIVRGGKQAYYKAPCFVTAKETISPLLFPEEDGRILSMLASKGLPCTIIPMPISGASCPVNIASNITMAAAEVLGVMACIRSLYPEAMIAGGVISGVMDMRAGTTSFSAPEAIMQDMGIAQLFNRKYGQDFALGTGCIDAQYPGSQLMMEYFAKMTASRAMGCCEYPVGNIGGAKRWSPVGAVLGIEIAKYIHRFDSALVSANDIPFDSFAEAGIGGSFIGDEHTLENFRDCIWMPDIICREQTMPVGDEMLNKAKEQWENFIKRDIDGNFAVSDEMAREIDKWREKAISILA